MQNSLENETCFWGFEIRPQFSKTNVFQGTILYPLAVRNIQLRNISWDLFITILGDLQNNLRREVVLPYVG